MFTDDPPDLQREDVLQGLAGSSHFPRSSFGGIFSSAGLPESQDFPETGPPPSSCPPWHAVPRRAYSSPLQFPKDAKSTRAVPADWEPFFHFLLFGRLLLNLQGPDSRSSLQSGSTPPSPGCQCQCSHLSVPPRSSRIPGTLYVAHSWLICATRVTLLRR